jgi:hypothetical protein
MAPVLYAGPQSDLAVALVADGVPANTVRLNIQ